MKLSQIFENIRQAVSETEFLPTGFSKLDRFLDGGFMKRELVIFGAPTGLGKSYICGQIMQNCARKGFSTAYFSLEISGKMIASRLIGAETNLKPTRIISNDLTHAETELRVQAENSLQAYDTFFEIYDDVYELQKIKDFIISGKYELVIIDFAQQIMIRNNSDEYSRLTQIASELQELAKTQNCCIVLVSQLSNLVSREGARGKALEFKGSGSLGTAADLAFYLEREAYNQSEYQPVRLTLKKNRRGISGAEFELQFRHPGGQFYET